MSPQYLSNLADRKFNSVRPEQSSTWSTLAGLWQRALPQNCAFCAAPCGNRLVCAACQSGLPRIASPCPVCALPAPGGLICGACVARPPPFAAAFAAFAYEFPLDRLLHAFKYGGHLSHAEYFAEALSAVVAVRPARMRWPDVLVALPLAPSRQRARGFDQAAEIARRVARRTGVPMATGLRRTRDTPAQAALPWKDRASNVRGAFEADPSLAGMRVAVVDDVMTTGATLGSAAGALLRAGAVAVEAWAVARTLPPTPRP